MRFTFGELREFLEWINKICTPSRYVFYVAGTRILAVPTVSTPPIQVAIYFAQDLKEMNELIEGLRHKTYKVFYVEDFAFSTESER